MAHTRTQQSGNGRRARSEERPKNSHSAFNTYQLIREKKEQEVNKKSPHKQHSSCSPDCVQIEHERESKNDQFCFARCAHALRCLFLWTPKIND